MLSDNMRDICGDGISVSFLCMTLYYSFIRCYHQEKPGKGDKGT